MYDTLSPLQRHHCMSSIRSVSTKPEVKLRHGLWRRGFRYKKNDKSLPGTPDVVLPKYKSVVFIHGCFWHGHLGCKKYVVPKSNTEFWIEKVSKNKQRDENVWRQLEAKGWSVIVVWECEIEKRNFSETLDRVENEIIANGELHRNRQQERRMIRELRLAERRAQKEKYAALKTEL
ncbi:MAG: DNA mismatch endonuclease Vsr [Butyrivibrio sp.]|nr:DNA mismatch endonuclease Vsr [Butyrivibrio sp.]